MGRHHYRRRRCPRVAAAWSALRKMVLGEEALPGARLPCSVNTWGMRGEKRGVAMQHIDRFRDEPGQVESGTPDLCRVERHDARLGYPGPLQRQNGDLVAQLGEPSGQPHHDPLRPAITASREGGCGSRGRYASGPNVPATTADRQAVVG